MSTHDTGRLGALKHELKQRWNRLTDEDIESVHGNIERLADALQLRHGYNRIAAMREIGLWSGSLARRT